jgi:SAM-dependent methyltransferase
MGEGLLENIMKLNIINDKNKTDETIIDFWKNNAINNIIPNTGEEFPEGWDVRNYLQTSFSGTKRVTEVGCGYGRLAKAYSSELYLGLDVSPGAIEVAKFNNPEHEFRVVDWKEPYPETDIRLVYTVLLHMNDNMIDEVVSRLCENTTMVLVAEIMGRSWRREGDPPVFNREAQEYKDIFWKYDFELAGEELQPYARYPNTFITFQHYIHKDK